MAKFLVHIEVEFTYDGIVDAADEETLRSDIESDVDEYVTETALAQNPGHQRIDITPLNEAGDDGE